MNVPNVSPVEWTSQGLPRSRLYGDVYFSSDDGLAESRTVFLDGCGLPQAWAGRRRFVVGELGFGCGLNIAALLQRWGETREPGAHLHVFTVEAHPLVAAEAARALGRWPELAPIAALMAARWPGRARGFHRLDLPEFGATVDVAVMEVAQALSGWVGAADAWFLDGFAPAANPAIWRPEVIELVARRSAPGARAATYTVAGAVRRSLAEAGFVVERRPGHGRKRQRLEARLPAATPPPARSPTIAIVGAGIAGASLSRALTALGAEARVFDAARPGSGASGAPAGLAAPRLDAGLGPAAALFAQAARRAVQLYDAVQGAVIGESVVQLPTGSKDPGRFAAIAASDLFEPGDMASLTAEAASARLGEPAPAALLMGGSRVIAPRVVLDAWLGATERGQVERLEPCGGAWRLIDPTGATLAEVEVVVVAAAMGTTPLIPGVTLTPVRGQASLATGIVCEQAAAFGAYVIPLRDGTLIGATHHRQDTGLEPRMADRRRNLAAVATGLPALAARLGRAPLADWTAVRATTGDYLPLAGAVPGGAPGLMTLTGLGSRGLCLAPLLAEHMAAQILDAPSPLPADLAVLVDPGRFAARAARKGRPRTRGTPVAGGG